MAIAHVRITWSRDVLNMGCCHSKSLGEVPDKISEEVLDEIPKEVPDNVPEEVSDEVRGQVVSHLHYS